MDKDYLIKRAMLQKIKKHLSKKEITIISGIRQCGKSTVLNELKSELELENKKTLYLNFDFDNDRRFLMTQTDLINKLKFEFDNQKAYIFIDEIQRKENAGIYLKGIYDLRLPYKFIVSGSGSIELKEKIQESLAGRKRVFEMNTVSFLEFVDYKTDYKYSDKLKDFFKFEPEKTNELLKEYLNYGGFPRIVTEEDKTEKIELINEIYNSYIEKDLVNFLNINNPQLFKDIFTMLAFLSGKLVNFSYISGNTDTSVSTLKRYLYFAEKTFSLKKIRPYYNNIAKELRKSPMYYFTDVGLMNYALGKFGNLTNSMDLGFVFQTFIFNILREVVPQNYEIKYWRTTDKAEIDFVIDKISDTIPIEIKYSKLKSTTIPRSFRSFLKKYNPKKAFIINLTLEKKVKVEKTEVNFIPYTKLFDDKIFE